MHIGHTLPSFLAACELSCAASDANAQRRKARSNALRRAPRANDRDAPQFTFEWSNARVKPPIVVGHEFAGEVVKVGSLVTDVREGDRVTAEGHIVDGRCLLCRTGNSHVCPHTKIIGVDRDGCFAEYIAMPATNVWHLDDNISYDIGGIHDPMGNAFHTALTADIPGSTVLVTGCGPIGIFAAGICRAAGASWVVASDVNPKRLELARTMGAHDAVHPTDVETVVKGL